MSKGLGRMERAILVEIHGYEDINGEMDQHITRAMIADAVFADRKWAALDRPTRAQFSSFNRGFRSLIHKGLVEEIDWPNAVWTTEEGRRVAELS